MLNMLGCNLDFVKISFDFLFIGKSIDVYFVEWLWENRFKCLVRCLLNRNDLIYIIFVNLRYLRKFSNNYGEYVFRIVNFNFVNIF